VKPRTLGVIAAVVALPTLAALVPDRLDGVTNSRTSASNNTATATLVGVKVLTMGDAPSSAFRDATRTSTGRRLAAQCTNPGPGTRAYNLRGIRVSGPTTAHLNPAGAPAGAASAFQAAFNTWRAADANAPSITVVSDSSVSSPQADGRYELMFAPLAGRTLAVTYTWTRRGVAESDVVFNNKVSFFMAPGEGDGCYEGVAKYDLQNIATHEFGHVYGLDHVSATYNTMAPTATLGETYKRSLASGDAAGIRAIY
jgi:Matrixin